MAPIRLIVSLLLTTTATGFETAQWPGSCRSTQRADDVVRDVDLSGKTVVLTGADGNIAGEVSQALAKRGALLILACRTAAKCEAVRQDVAKHAKSSAMPEVGQLDLSSRESIAAFVNSTVKKHPKIDVLINSAGTYGTFMTKDAFVGVMEINLLGPAYLTHLLLPSLRGDASGTRGRVVNVAAATYGTRLPNGTTSADLAKLCTSVDKTLNETGAYFQMSKFLMTHHALELAKRESQITAFAVNPGVAVLPPSMPDWLTKSIIRFPYPDWMLRALPQALQRYVKACRTNEAGLEACPETLAQGAAVISAAASWAGVDDFSGSYLDFETSPLPPDAPQLYGPWTQKDPTCTPREPPAMDPSLRSAWYDEMLRLMSGHSTSAVPSGDTLTNSLPSLKTLVV
eukprot:TRINITY_DN74148_c0_g1_i1.p1 TRINITY_DN74148_c0_g1~~TRINITY_DN74148_c0_g1_i1.p1  ORF type:complete len:400 (-),score=53.04 TRINITY_DN74148_c0_g1_i1:368-1567(-)